MLINYQVIQVSFMQIFVVFKTGEALSLRNSIFYTECYVLLFIIS